MRWRISPTRSVLQRCLGTAVHSSQCRSTPGSRSHLPDRQRMSRELAPNCGPAVRSLAPFSPPKRSGEGRTGDETTGRTQRTEPMRPGRASAAQRQRKDNTDSAVTRRTETHGSLVEPRGILSRPFTLLMGHSQGQPLARRWLSGSEELGEGLRQTARRIMANDASRPPYGWNVT
ncbi:hypothetical protein SKAU_G00068420 [Synaphobranchus kaupii]|uniref:Uncharacterized protein n=1 Tax=Synaphobranchus kaupii TaxID=118154 RepID=A0A9Q1JBH2_SYNKA|nr:hypothetical protein SKAU_G00068420 [Synaphobranchus kaupii]